MKRKKFIIEICLFMLIGLLTGCGKSGSGDAEDAAITSKWKLVEFAVNRETTRPSDEPFYVRLFTSGMNPAFSCKDGENCVFHLGNKDREGTVVKEDDKYIIYYGESKKPMIGRIEGKQLVLSDENEKLKFVFETK